MPAQISCTFLDLTHFFCFLYFFYFKTFNFHFNNFNSHAPAVSLFRSKLDSFFVQLAVCIKQVN